jgi:hypothetical protein
MGCGASKNRTIIVQRETIKEKKQEILEVNTIKFGVFTRIKKKGLYKVNEVTSSQEYSLPASGEFVNTFSSISSNMRHSK